jgi:Domain of unknown function (DUF4336)
MARQLSAAGDDIWIAEGDVVSFYGFPYPTRSVVVRLQDGGLWIWSPIALSMDLQRDIDAIGTPEHLVSPNKIHHLYLGEWHSAYPKARLWGPASTIKKRSDLEFEPPLVDEPPAAWKGEIDQCWFRGSPVLDEIVFFHRASRTAILADLSENFSERWLHDNWAPWQRAIARLWGIVEGKGYAPLEWRLSFIDRTALRDERAKMLDWNPKQVIMAHGEWQRDAGKDFLTRAFSWAG